MKKPSPTIGYALVNKETGKIEWSGVEKPKKIEWNWGQYNWDLIHNKGYGAFTTLSHRLIRVQIKPVASKGKKV